MSVKAQFVTHVVENQPLALPAYNAWTTDPALQNAVERNGGGWGAAALAAHGATTGGVMMELGDQANRNKPVLRSFDRYGRRIDEVEFHPAYHQLMRHAMQAEVHNFSWRHQDDAGAHVVRAGLIYLNGQPDSGTNCPLTMTHAVVPALRNAILATVIMVFVFALGSYLLPQLLGRPQQWTLSVLITDQAIYQSNMPFAAAMAVFLVLVSLALVVLSTLLGQKEGRS